MTFQWDSKMTVNRYFVVMTIHSDGMSRYALALVGKGKKYGKVFDLVPRYVRIDSNRAKLTARAKELNDKITEKML